MKPLRCGHAEVNGIQLYHEIYGEGDPLVLIHGGLTTIGQMQGWVQQLAATRQVIQSPDRVRRLVVISSPHARSCWYPEARDGMSGVSASGGWP